MEKTCTLCSDVKPLDCFYKAPGCKDGRAGQCIECVKRRARIRQIVKSGQIRAYEQVRSRLPHRIAARAANLQREKHNNPERALARSAVSNAVRDGKLLRMDCAFCGSSKTIAHHHDYSKPFDVTWLCTPCHIRFHALEGMAARANAVEV